MIVTLVRPTPSFSSSVLFALRSAQAASLTRRSQPLAFAAVQELPFTTSDDNVIPTLFPGPSQRHLDDRSDYWISAGWNLQCKIQADSTLCEIWDDSCGCWRPKDPPITIHLTTATLYSYDIATATHTSFVTTSRASHATSVSRASPALDRNQNSTSKTRTHHLTLSSSSRHRATAASSLSSSNNTATGNGSSLSGTFQGLWVS